MTREEAGEGRGGAGADPGSRRDVALGPGAEFDLIRAFLEAADAPSEMRVPAGDDAAVVSLLPGEDLVISTDATVEEVHFRREWMSWETVGWRAVAAALSDLAAMAARPVGALVSVLLPPELERGVAVSLASGVGSCLRAEGAGLLGGDVSRSPGPVVLDVVAVGGARTPVSRAGARPGDEAWVTGRLGGAAAAVSDLRRGLEPDPGARRRLERPRPRIREARWLRERDGMRAGIDLSDGLAGDARHLAAASGLALELELDAVPLDPSLEAYPRREAALRLAVTGGEDYELLVAAPAGRLGGLREAFEDAFEIPLTRVGTAREGHGVRWSGAATDRLRDGPASPSGFDHFAPDDGR